MTSAAPLRRRVKLGYSYADFGINAVETIARFYLLKFYTDVVGLSPRLAGYAVALGLIWDAVTDPAMGFISDRLRHRFGGRRFFVLAGSFFLAAGLILVFSPPPLETEGARFTWLLATYVFWNTGLTIMAIPHTAMSGELTDDPHDRSVLFGLRFAFANLGAVLAFALPVSLSTGDQGSSGGLDSMAQVAWIVGLLIVAGGLSVWFSTRSVVPHASRDAIPTRFRDLLAPLANPAFRPLVLAYVIATLGVGVNAAVALYYYTSCVDLGDAEIRWLLLAFISAFTLSLAPWVRISRSFGKLRPLTAGACALGVSTTVLYLFLPEDNFALAILLGGVGIGSFFGCTLLIDSLLTDVIDHDRLWSGIPRSGLFFGCWRFAAKLARAGALFITGHVLEAVGYGADKAPDEGVRGALRILFGPGVGLFFLTAAFVLARYRFSDAKQRQVRRLIARRHVRALDRSGSR